MKKRAGAKAKPQARRRRLDQLVGRRILFDWIMHKAGIELGQRYPWWGIALMMVLFPSRIPMFIGTPFYDAWTDCIKVGNVKLPLHALADTYGKPSPPGNWFRVVGKTEWGTPIIEQRTDGYVVPDPSNPAVTVPPLVADKVDELVGRPNDLSETKTGD